MDVQHHVTSLLNRIEIGAWRLLLETPRVRATVPMLRGVWGRALRHLDEEAYRRVFVGDGPTHRRLPRYILRPAPPDPVTAPAVEWMVLNVDARLEAVLWRAWDVAGGMGLGAERVPFRVRQRLGLGPGGGPVLDEAQRWRLSDAGWPLAGDPTSTPCRLDFPLPLRLIGGGALLAAPEVEDIAASALRRIAGLAGEARGEGYRNLMRAVRREAAALAASPWRGERVDLVRWSGRQRLEIDLYGVQGGLHLPGGAGQLWPLLAAAQWAHIGKGTVFVLGKLRISEWREGN